MIDSSHKITLWRALHRIAISARTYRRSSRQSAFVMQEVAMIGGTERLLEARRAVPADRQKSIGEAEALLLTNASQPLAKGNRDRGCHALAGQLCQFLCHQVGLAILDIQSHF